MLLASLWYLPKSSNIIITHVRFAWRLKRGIFTAWVWYVRADCRLAPSQWETSLQSNAVSHWLGANLESILYMDVPGCLQSACWIGNCHIHLTYCETRLLESKGRISMTFIWNSKAFIHETAFENVICKTSRPHMSYRVSSWLFWRTWSCYK